MRLRLLVLIILAATAGAGCAIKVSGVTAFVATPLSAIYVTNSSKCSVELVRNGEYYTALGVGATTSVRFTSLSNMVLIAKAYTVEGGQKVFLGSETRQFYPSQDPFYKFDWTITAIAGRCSLQW